MTIVKLGPRTRVGHAAKFHGSKVTSGARVFVEGGDAKSRWSRRWKDLILAHGADLGGPELLSEAQVSIIRCASAVECELEAMEGRMSEGQKIDLDQYGRLAGRLCKMLDNFALRQPVRCQCHR